MLSTLLVLALSGAPSGWCDNVRAVHRLAVRDGLDDRTLATLERRYCQPAPSTVPLVTAEPSSGVSRDCADVWTMAVLARASRALALLPVLDGQVRVCCSPGAGEQSALRWPSGQWAKSGGGWWYPNGHAARSGSSWWYPNGRVAHSGAGWWFPSGKLARRGEAWVDPDGGRATSSDAVLAWFCEAHAAVCSARLLAMRGLPEEARTAGIIELLSAVGP